MQATKRYLGPDVLSKSGGHNWPERFAHAVKCHSYTESVIGIRNLAW
jgi:hypothetical protein